MAVYKNHIIYLVQRIQTAYQVNNAAIHNLRKVARNCSMEMHQTYWQEKFNPNGGTFFKFWNPRQL